MEAAAQRTRTRYYGLRLITIAGAVIVPALVSINAVGGTREAITWITFAVSLVVALSAAVEGFVRFGDRWRHYRGLVEELKLEGWAFHELSGPYRVEGATHESVVSDLRGAGERASRPRDADLHLGDRGLGRSVCDGGFARRLTGSQRPKRRPRPRSLVSVGTSRPRPAKPVVRSRVATNSARRLASRL